MVSFTEFNSEVVIVLSDLNIFLGEGFSWFREMKIGANNRRARFKEKTARAAEKDRISNREDSKNFSYEKIRERRWQRREGEILSRGMITGNAIFQNE